jgi:hypothetical protein
VLAATTAVVGLVRALHDGAPGSERWHAAWPGARSPTSVHPEQTGTTRRTTTTESRCGGVAGGYRCARSAGNRSHVVHRTAAGRDPHRDQRLRGPIPEVYGPRPSTGAGTTLHRISMGGHGTPDPVGPSPPRSTNEHPWPQPVHRCG